MSISRKASERVYACGKFIHHLENRDLFAMDSMNHALSGCHDIGHHLSVQTRPKKVIIRTGMSCMLPYPPRYTKQIG